MTALLTEMDPDLMVRWALGPEHPQLPTAMGAVHFLAPDPAVLGGLEGVSGLGARVGKAHARGPRGWVAAPTAAFLFQGTTWAGAPTGPCK